jgi:hypothetical protein
MELPVRTASSGSGKIQIAHSIAGLLRIPAGKAALAAGVQSWVAPRRGEDRHGSFPKAGLDVVDGVVERLDVVFR